MITIISLVGVAEIPCGSGIMVAMVYTVAFSKKRINSFAIITKTERMNSTAQTAKQLFHICFFLQLSGGVTEYTLNDGTS